jgi:hypothetical protein
LGWNFLKIDEDTGLPPQFVSHDYRLAGNRRNHVS